MPRYRDEWVIDRVLFDYVSGGACSCCGLQHFLPNGLSDLIGAVSDLDTDQQNNEVAALAFHPWPPELREQVWADRVRLRQKLKLDKKKYQTIWEDSDVKKKFLDWCWNPSTTRNYRRWFQLSRSEIMETIQQRYNIHSAFGVVLCAVIEQVANFPLTEYPLDGRGSIETDFEKLLIYDRRGGFTLPLFLSDDNDNEADVGTVNERALKVWLNQMEHSVGSSGQQLLVRGTGSSNPPVAGRQANNSNDDNDESNENEDGDPDISIRKTPQAQTSFASDRRIVRLVIARIWAELLESKFLEQNS
ncbi:hypothetical protein ACA910_004121 [Epithemia clementina (nom. ined.)]